MEKIKNLPAMRLVAFAVAVAIILGLSSAMLSFTASAENVDNVNALDLSAHQLGTLGAYPVIGIPTSGLLADYISTSDESGSMSMRDYFLPFVVFNGDIYYYNRLVYIGYHRSYFDKFPNCALAFYGQCNFSPIYDSLKSGNTSPSKKYDYRYFSFSESGNTLTVTNSEYPSNTWAVTYEFKSASGVTLSSSNVNRILFARVKTCLSTDDTVDVSDISSYINSSDTYKDTGTGSEPSAKFVTCASYTNDDGSFPLWCKSFVAEGQQYPLFTYFIKDNGNKHKYSLVLSYNNNDLAGALCTALYDSITSDQWRNGVKAPSAQWFVANVMGTMHNAGDMVKKAAVTYFETGWRSATYSQSFNLNGSDMDFTNCADDGNKVFTLCLSDYSAIVKGQIYKVEIWDNTASQILDTTYFVSRDAFGKSNSGTGVKIYDYKDNGDQMEQDIINNTPSVPSTKGDDFTTTGDIEWSQFNDDLANVDISSIFSSLHSAINSVGVFFQACWAIIPSSIFAILLSGLSLIIVLRILGR